MVRQVFLEHSQLGRTTPEMENIVMQLLFNGVDDLLGGNYNTFRNQRNRIVSNKAPIASSMNALSAVSEIVSPKASRCAASDI